jgi:hypothetical protein
MVTRKGAQAVAAPPENSCERSTMNQRVFQRDEAGGLRRALEQQRIQPCPDAE